MKNKVLQRPTPNASLPRNGFDRGFEMKYNFSAGLALPVFCEPVLGETKMRINRKCLIRAAQLQTAAMVRNSFNIDFFFVPFRQMWSYYGSSRTGTKDYHSSKLALATNVSLESMPRFAARTGSGHHDLFTMVDTLHTYSSTESNFDIHGYSADLGCHRLLDLLNYGLNAQYTPDSSSLVNWMDTLPSMNPFKLLAYQKVWYDHYRLTNYVWNNPMAYNLDNLINTDGSTNSITSDQLASMGTMHYVPYRKDYFQNIYPSLNYAPINQMNTSTFFAVPNNVVGANFDYSWQGSSTNYYIRTNVLSNSGGIGQTTNSTGIYQPLVNQKTSASSTGTAFTAQSIRALFALDKMTRLAAYAPKHVADQFEARFGFRPKGEDINESVRIGSFVSDISIGEVVSSANTEISSSGVTTGSKLGAIGARGFSVAGFEKDIEYMAPEDGIIIGIAYALPRLSYDAGGIDEFNQLLTTMQFPQPEFMDMGLQPLRQNSLFHISRPDSGVSADTWNNRILGYQPMYSEWKIGKDRNHGLFVYGSQLAPFTTHTRLEYTQPYGDESHWSSDGVSAKYFYASPKDLNPIFVSAYDGTQLSDQFFGMIQFKFDVVQNMSVHGQPRI